MPKATYSLLPVFGTPPFRRWARVIPGSSRLTTLRIARLLLILAATRLAQPAEKYELRGQLFPSAGKAVVVLSGVTAPFSAQARTNGEGQFRFKNLDPGSYAVWVFVQFMEDTQRTVEVDPNHCDAKRRVTVTIQLTSIPPSVMTLQERHTVPLKRVTVPRAAKSEYDQAKILLGKNDIPSATRGLERAVEIAPQFAAAWNDLGAIAFRSGNYLDAERFFRKALDLEPRTYSYLVNLGGALLKQERPEEAMEYNLLAIASRPIDPQALAQVGINFALLRMYDSALTYLRRAKRFDPGSPWFPQLFLARIYLLRSDRAAAIGELEDFLARHPNVPEAREARLNLEKLRAP